MGQKSLVFASREPAMRTYAASCIDIACKPLVINQSWLYDRHLNTVLMKERLVEVLNEYPTLTGRVSDNSIICNNAGVFWEENQLPDISVKELSKVTLPEKRFQAEFNNKAAVAGAFPLLSVKVSHLKDGTILNVKCSHFCADGGTFYRMMENWSSLARDEGFVRKPVYDDTAVSKALAATNVYGELASHDMKGTGGMLECLCRFLCRIQGLLHSKTPGLSDGMQHCPQLLWRFLDGLWDGPERISISCILPIIGAG